MAKVNGQNIHIVGNGATLITALQAGNPQYNSASPVSNLLTVKKTQQITFGQIPTKNLTDPDFDPLATVSSGLKISYSSSDTTVARIVAQKVHITGSGSAVITAAQSGDSTYTAAIPVSVNLTVKKAQAITFNAFSPKTSADTDLYPDALASSGLPVRYASADTTVATVLNGKIYITGSGSVLISATQAGDSVYSAAVPVQRILTVKKT